VYTSHQLNGHISDQPGLVGCCPHAALKFSFYTCFEPVHPLQTDELRRRPSHRVLLGRSLSCTCIVVQRVIQSVSSLDSIHRNHHTIFPNYQTHLFQSQQFCSLRLKDNGRTINRIYKTGQTFPNSAQTNAFVDSQDKFRFQMWDLQCFEIVRLQSPGP